MLVQISGGMIVDPAEMVAIIGNGHCGKDRNGNPVVVDLLLRHAPHVLQVSQPALDELCKYVQIALNKNM